MWAGSVTPATKSFLGGASDSTPPGQKKKKENQPQECSAMQKGTSDHFIFIIRLYTITMNILRLGHKFNSDLTFSF